MEDLSHVGSQGRQVKIERVGKFVFQIGGCVLVGGQSERCQLSWIGIGGWGF